MGGRKQTQPGIWQGLHCDSLAVVQSARTKMRRKCMATKAALMQGPHVCAGGNVRCLGRWGAAGLSRILAASTPRTPFAVAVITTTTTEVPVLASLSPVLAVVDEVADVQVQREVVAVVLLV